MDIGNLARTLVVMTAAGAKLMSSQTVPQSPSTMWQSPASHEGGRATTTVRPAITPPLDPTHVYSLAELIDIAEQRNPETRVVWERAKQQAAQVGIARSNLYPLLASSALLQQTRNRVLFGAAFYRQDLTVVDPTLNLMYTILDFGARASEIEAAQATLLAANFSFNETHERIIFDVAAAYYELISAQGQIEAGQATVTSSQTVQEAVEERLKNGLATLPDVLEARASTAQAAYDLENARGAERLARGSLAEVVSVSPMIVIRVQPLPANGTSMSALEPVGNAIERAVRQRPDLLAQAARVDAASAGIKRARSNYFPTVGLNASGSYQFERGLQEANPSVTTSGDTWFAELSAKWTIFDAHRRYEELDRARSEHREAQAELDAMRDRVEVEVWNAYSNLQTALHQQDAAIALLEAANQSYSASIEAYRYGVKSFLDVVSAQRTLAQARTAQVVARARVLGNAANLAFRTGDLVSAQALSGKP